MKNNWFTNKGDEWSYRRGNVQAFADRDSSDLVFSIRGASVKGKSLTQKQLLRLLQDSNRLFPELNIEIKLTKAERQLMNRIRELQLKGSIETQSKESDSNLVFSLSSVKERNWWLLW